MWWLAHGEEHLPEGLAWLSAAEQAMLAGIRYRKRHVEFLTRRWTAKRALAAVLQRDADPQALAGIEIAHQIGGAPYVRLDGQRSPIEVSLSDRAGWAVCLAGAIGESVGPLGIDLELVEPRSEAFVADFFTAAECRHVASLAPGEARDEAANLIWSAKEAALKVLKVGLRADTREVEVTVERSRRTDGWARLRILGRDGREFPGWWRRDGVFLLTVAATAEMPPPAPLDGDSRLAQARPLHSWLAQPLM